MRNAWTHKLAAGAIAALIGSALGAAGAAAARPSARAHRPQRGWQRQQHAAPDVGARPAWPTAASHRPTTPTAGARRWPRPSPTATSATGSSTTSARTSSPRTACRSGGGCGASSSIMTSGSESRRPGESSPLPFNQADPLERSRTTSARSGSRRTPRRRRRARRATRQQLNTITSYLDASMVYGSDATRATWLRDGASLLPARRIPAAGRRPRERGNGARDGPVRRPGRRSRPGGRRRRREGEREHRPHRRPDDLRPRAQPHRAAAADVALRRAQVPDRAAGRRRGDPVHHLPRLPAGDGRPARPVHGLQAGGRSDGVQRVRDGRLPGALDGARRDGAVARPRARGATRSWRRSRRAGSWSSTTRGP